MTARGVTRSMQSTPCEREASKPQREAQAASEAAPQSDTTGDTRDSPRVRELLPRPPERQSIGPRRRNAIHQTTSDTVSGESDTLGGDDSLDHHCINGVPDVIQERRRQPGENLARHRLQLETFSVVFDYLLARTSTTALHRLAIALRYQPQWRFSAKCRPSCTSIVHDHDIAHGAGCAGEINVRCIASSTRPRTRCVSV